MSDNEVTIAQKVYQDYKTWIARLEQGEITSDVSLEQHIADMSMELMFTRMKERRLSCYTG